MLVLLIPGLFVTVHAQVTSPEIKAGFGVDADLRSNFFNSALQGGNDDWFSNIIGGTGQFIIDTTGAGFIISRYITQPGTRMLPFFRNMRFPQFSIVNGKMLIDGIFIRDHHGDDSTVFASGSNKNGMNPSSWTTPVSQGIPDKNDILDMFMHVRRNGSNTNDSLWMFGGLSLDNTTGNRFFDFEMYQTDIYYDKPSLKFYGYGPDAGHTAWQFDASGNVIKAGDIILTAEYSSSALSALEARIWINKSSLSITPVAFSWGGLFDGDGSGATYGYANIKPKTAGDFYTGLQCKNGTWGGPFQIVLQNNAIATDYTNGQFMEFSVNLTKLGLDPLVTMGDACAMPFRRILVKSRASTSFTAELKDFVGPFSLFRAPMADVATNFPVLCENGVGSIWVKNPIQTSLYTWVTPDGSIVGGTSGDSITINRAGTYIVRQELMDSCKSIYATDTIVITQSPVCNILAGKPVGFTAKLNQAIATVTWNSDGFTAGESYEVERSLDGIRYTTISIVKASDTYVYKLTDDLHGIATNQVFYRLKYNGSGGRIVYSNIVKLLLRPASDQQIRIAPNPVTDQFKLSFSVTMPVQVTISIVNSTGAVVHQSVEKANTGLNEWIINKKPEWNSGQYILQISYSGEVYRKRLNIIY